jgi:hypothetical protein
VCLMEASSNWTLQQKAVALSAQLGLDAQLPVAETVAQAVAKLGLLEDEVKDLNLVERANKCLQQVLPTAHGVAVASATATTNAAMPAARAFTTTAGMPVTYGSQAVPFRAMAALPPEQPVPVGMQRDPGQREENCLPGAGVPPAAKNPISATLLRRGCPCACNIGFLFCIPFLVGPGFACYGEDHHEIVMGRSSEDVFTKWQWHGIPPFCIPDLGERWVRLGRSNHFRRTDATTCKEEDDWLSRRHRVYRCGRCITHFETSPVVCHFGCQPICP